MSMSTCVVGFRPPDDRWKKMKAIWDSCEAANIDVPNNVDEFFDGEPPDDAGVVVDLEDSDCCEPYSDDWSTGFEIDISKLPKDLTILRFYNSW